MLRLFINAYHLWLSNAYLEEAKRQNIAGNYMASVRCEDIARNRARMIK